MHQLHQRAKAELPDVLKSLLKEDPASEHLVLLHQSVFSRADLAALMAALSPKSSICAHFFGGGSDYVYYAHDRDAGLLEQRGDLAHRKFYDGVRGPSMLIDDELDPVRFRQVWRHYFYQCKRHLFEARADVLHRLTDSVLLHSHAGTARQLLNAADQDLTARLENTLQLVSEHYNDETAAGKSVAQPLAALQAFTEEQEIAGREHLHELNLRFAALLDTIHEPAY